MGLETKCVSCLLIESSDRFILFQQRDVDYGRQLYLALEVEARRQSMEYIVIAFLENLNGNPQKDTLECFPSIALFGFIVTSQPDKSTSSSSSSN